MTTNESPTNFHDHQYAERTSGPPRQSQSSLWGDVGVAAGAWILSILFIIFIPFFVAVPYIIHIAVNYGPPDMRALVTDKGFLFLSVMGVLPAHCATFALIWLIVTYAGRLPFNKAIGLEWPKSLGPIWGSALSIVVAVALLAMGGVITYFFGDKKTDIDLLVESSTQARWATAFVAFFTAPLVEECLYRGLLYPSFEKAFNGFLNRGPAMALAICAVATLFAGVHYPQYKDNLAVFSVITILSVSLTLVRSLSGKLMPCFVIHLVFNGIQSFVLVFGPYFTLKLPAPPSPAPAVGLFLDLIRFLS